MHVALHLSLDALGNAQLWKGDFYDNGSIADLYFELFSEADLQPSTHIGRIEVPNAIHLDDDMGRREAFLERDGQPRHLTLVQR